MAHGDKRLLVRLRAVGKEGGRHRPLQSPVTVEGARGHLRGLSWWPLHGPRGGTGALVSGHLSAVHGPRPRCQLPAVVSLLPGAVGRPRVHRLLVLRSGEGRGCEECFLETQTVLVISAALSTLPASKGPHTRAAWCRGLVHSVPAASQRTSVRAPGRLLPGQRLGAWLLALAGLSVSCPRSPKATEGLRRSWAGNLGQDLQWRWRWWWQGQGVGKTPGLC